MRRGFWSRLAAVAAFPAAVATPLAGAGAEAGAPGISDNSFLIEEAYNQERGVVQHIQNATWAWDRVDGRRVRTFSYIFTQEWPLGGVRHQAAYSIPWQAVRDPAAARVSGLGEIGIHYRYQVWEETDLRPAFAPRFTVLLPTGSEAKGLGAGAVGVQVNLPLSKRLGDYHFHGNLGATATPNADLPFGGGTVRHDLLSYQAGGSLLWVRSPRFQPMVEVLAANEESIDAATGLRAEATTLTLSPGARYAWNFPDGSQLVAGAAVPVALTREGDDYAAFLYLSYEHAFRRSPD